MATGLTDSSNYQAIADAIRAKNGSDETYMPSEMAEAIEKIETGMHLDALENQASPEHIKQGFAAYDAEGNVVAGILEPDDYDAGFAAGAQSRDEEVAELEAERDAAHDKGYVTGYAVGHAKGAEDLSMVYIDDDSVVVLGVEKVVTDTYDDDANAAYEAEEFILLDIYPKTNGTVTVTYGGVTKTVTDTTGAEAPNALQVFFGTFHGVTDEVETPASGILTIAGDYESFAVGTHNVPKWGTAHIGCITKVISFGMVTSIPDDAFYDCRKLLAAVMPNTVTRIGYQAFYDCGSLSVIVIPEGVTQIASWAFYNASQTTLVIPENVTKILYRTFYNCSDLTTLIVPDSVTEIDPGAFGSCYRLTNMMIGTGNEHYSFDGGLLFNKDKTVLCICISAHDSVAVPDGVTSIGEDAFRGYAKVTDVIFPDSLMSIGPWAFSNCIGLTTLVIPDGVTSIGGFAFYQCSNITSVIFENPSGWYITDSETGNVTPLDVTDPVANATLLTANSSAEQPGYANYTWNRS